MYWSSTKSSAQPPRASYQTAERDALLRAAQGVDPAMLAEDMGMSQHIVRAYQRRLGVREITGYKRKGER